jgi:Mycobacterium membrane protein
MGRKNMKPNNRDHDRHFHIRDIAGKFWLWIVVTAVLTSAAVFVGTLRHRGLDTASIVHSAPAVTMGTPAPTTVVYAVKGPAGADATLAYIQPDGPVQRVATRLPWSVSVQTRSLAPAASVVAQSAARSISCEISVDGSTLIARQSAQDFFPVDCTLPVA